MTTIHTIEDLVRVLDERPDWTEALRARILTRELLNLPQAFAEFAENTERRLVALETGQAELAAVLGRFMDNTERRQAALEDGQAALTAGQAALADTLAKFMESTERRQAALEAGQAALADTLAKFMESTERRLGVLEAGHTELVAGQAALVAGQAALADTLAKFMEGTERRLSALEAGQAALVARQDELAAGQAALVARQDELAAGQAVLVARQDELAAGQAALVAGYTELAAGQAALADTLAKFMESTERRLGAVETKLDQHTNEMAPLKAAHARNGALQMVFRIARIVRCREPRVLGEGDILDLIDDSDTAGIAQNELTSFENADIIIEARPRDNGAVHYIAVEASYTAGRNDARRAIRNAEFMTRFTGRPAHAVVASKRVNPAIAHLIESGELHWAEIMQKDLETD